MPLPSILSIGRPSRWGTFIQVQRPAYWMPGTSAIWLYVPKHAR
jgi:hypothetical protein